MNILLLESDYFKCRLLKMQILKLCGERTVPIQISGLSFAWRELSNAETLNFMAC